MASQKKNSPRSANRLLAALPSDAYRRVLPEFETVSLALKHIIYKSDKPIEHVYFPLSGVSSIVAYMKDGTGVEVATIGNEGMLGLPVFFGVGRTPLDAFQQVPGESLRMDADAFAREISRNGPLTQIIHQYTQTLITQIAQGNACNRLHSVEQRCARWLLMTHDRVGQNRFPLTQEFLSQMLGVRRASVNEVAATLKKEKLIDYSRGIIDILDRKGLERRACECYWVIRDEIDRLFGLD